MSSRDGSDGMLFYGAGHQVNQKGFVLPMTLIVLALLTVLSMGLSRMAKNTMQDVQLRKDSFERVVQFKGAAQWVLYQLLTGEPDKSLMRTGHMVLPLNGSPVQWNGVEIQVQDVAGLMGLGLYKQGSFRQLLEHYMSRPQAAVIAARLADWVDRDQLARYQGMEATDYIKAGLPMLPRNGPLRSLDELLEIPGITVELFNGDSQRPGLRDLLLAGGSGYFNLATAPEVLIGPMLGVSDKEAGKLLALRQQGAWQLLRQSVGNDPFGRSSSFSPGAQFRLLLKSDTGYSARAIYRLTPGKAVPYGLVLWQYPDFDRG